MIQSVIKQLERKFDLTNVNQKHVLWYLLKQRGYSEWEISKATKVKSHAGVYYGIKKIQVHSEIYQDTKELIKKGCLKVAGIATIKERENELNNTIESLYDQVDLIHIHTNDYSRHSTEKVINTYGVDLGDWGKFADVPENVWYLSCDDDIIYPKGYVDYMISKSTEYNCPVSLHGKILNPPVNSYYKSGIKFRCLDSVDNDIPVNCIGTGTMCFYSGQTPIPEFINGYMADLWFSALMQPEKIPLMVLKHKKGWLQYQQVQNTIYEKYKNNDDLQTQVVNKYLKTIYQPEVKNC